jgi:alpha-glucosidase
VSDDLWALPHHDGSSNYVSDSAPDLGDVVSVFLRVPRVTDITHAHLCSIFDGERQLIEAAVDRQDERDTWWRADLPIHNPVMSYRWLLDGGPHGYQWYNGAGLHRRDVTDAANFRIASHAPPPDWAGDAVLYQIFPDRFAKSIDRPTPDWAIPADWDDPVARSSPGKALQYYGGDLDGVREHLDHIASLGANTVYLTPFFPGHSNHRYNASTFLEVDPLLGGDEALHRLSEDLHARGMRLMGDLTTNHCGTEHDWFRAAVADPEAPEADYFIFERHPDLYACWLGHRTLPKFDHRNPQLRRALYEGPDSVVARWLGRGGLDGWRIDVANMTGRYKDVDVNHDVARAIRATMAAADPDSLLLAEHNFDASGDLLGDGWHGTMNYAGFSVPMWQWLRPQPALPLPHTAYPALPRLPGSDVVRAMRDFAAATPWRAVAHAMNLVSSHDSPRVRTVLQDEDLVTVAMGLLATMPGIPMIWSGDEIGMEGIDGEDGRRPFPWQHPERWDQVRLGITRALFKARADSPALRRGGLRWLATSDDAIVFARETPGETVVVQASRAEHQGFRLPAQYLGPRLTGIAGSPDVSAGRGHLALPADGPAFHMWRAEPST